MRKNADKRFIKSLGNRIRQLRKERDLTQEELAELADLHPTYIGGIERGERNPSISCLLRISDGLGLELKDLLAPLSKGSPSEGEDIYLEIISMLENKKAKELRWIKMAMADVIRWRESQ